MLRSFILRHSGKGAIAALLLSTLTLAAIGALQVTASVAGSASSELPAAAAEEDTPCTEQVGSVPALSTWSAVVMAILMLSASSFMMYGGNIAKRKHAVGAGSVGQPSRRNPVATGHTGELTKQEPSAKRREAMLRRERRHMSRTRRPTSRSKKRRVGPGCRGPLRKT